MINGDHGTTTSAEDKDAKRKSAFRYTSENSLETDVRWWLLI